MKRRFFVDMDGTLAKWNNVDMPDILYEEGYFESLEPNNNLVSSIKDLIKEGEDVYVLSSFLNDSKYALKEKQKWLDKYIPEIDSNKRIFVEYGKKKTDYIENEIDTTDYLIDDYTKNLIDWKNAGGTGIKFLNGINHTRKTWQGFLLNIDGNIVESLKEIDDLNTNKQPNFNNEYLELNANFLSSMRKYMDSVNESTEVFLNAEIEMKDAKKVLLDERKRLSELYKVEVASKWYEGEDLVVHYKIYIKNDKLIYEGYGFIDGVSHAISDNTLISHIYSFKVDNKIDITKASIYLQSFVKEILSNDTNGKIILDKDTLLNMWDIDEYELKEKYMKIIEEIVDYGLSNCIEINFSSDRFINYIEIKTDLITEFDFINEDYNLKDKSKELEEDYELEIT